MERRAQVLLGLGLALALAVAAALVVTMVPSGPTLSPTWASDPPAGAGGNHHHLAVGTTDGRMLVFAPISAPRQGPACRLAALDVETGEPVWHHEVPPADCTLHAVADPTVAEWNGRPSILVTTTENALFDLDPGTGEVRARYDLPSYGYTPPQVVDLTPGTGEEILVVDARGTVQVIGTDGEVVWQEAFGAYVWTRPLVGDLSGDGDVRVALGASDGRLLVLAGDGSTVHEIEAPFGSAVTWLASGQLDDDPAVELLAATADGHIVAVDASTGEVQWTRTFDRFAAVGAVGDGDGDGTPEVYATAADGIVRALAADTGRTLWEREVATDSVQMMPPPVLGDVTGNGVENLVVASNDGRVVALDPASGTLIAEHERDDKVFAAPTLADVDGEPGKEIFVIYADGTTIRLDYEE